MDIVYSFVAFGGLGVLGGIPLGAAMSNACWLKRAETGFWKAHRGKLYRVTEMTGKDATIFWRRQ